MSPSRNCANAFVCPRKAQTEVLNWSWAKAKETQNQMEENISHLTPRGVNRGWLRPHGVSISGSMTDYSSSSKRYLRMSAVIFMTPHASVRVDPQRWTPSCGGCRFNAKGILLPLPNKSKMCQHNFTLVFLDQKKYWNASPGSWGQRESLTLMCSCV